MTPASIIQEAQADGVGLILSPAGTIKATGDGAAVNRWLAVIRERKAEIIEALIIGVGDTATASRWWLIHYPDRDPLEVACCPEATHADILERHPDAVAAEPFTPNIRQPSAPLTAEEETAIRAWLALIEESDPATIAEVIGQCQRDADARDYFTGRAAAELPKPDRFPDDRRTCRQCLNLRGRVAERLILNYRTQSRSGEWQPMEYPVCLEWTDCHLGGRRPWFLCPAKGCGRRVAVIFGGSIFACRHCQKLAYQCQREPGYDRAARRADTIRRRLGWEAGILNGNGGKPKGMHWRTFVRLKAEYSIYANVAWAGMAERLGLLNQRLPGLRDDLNGGG